eukprot:scaffold85077_cov51-Phaeocystis_antarctica.AAC.2
MEAPCTAAPLAEITLGLQQPLGLEQPLSKLTGRAHSAEAKQPAQRAGRTRGLPVLLVGELPIRRAHPTARAALPFEDLRLCKGGREEGGKTERCVAVTL